MQAERQRKLQIEQDNRVYFRKLSAIRERPATFRASSGVALDVSPPLTICASSLVYAVQKTHRAQQTCLAIDDNPDMIVWQQAFWLLAVQPRLPIHCKRFPQCGNNFCLTKETNERVAYSKELLQDLSRRLEPRNTCVQPGNRRKAQHIQHIEQPQATPVAIS
jgi:hypothetical protein